MWLSILMIILAPQQVAGWELFATVDFEIRYIEELGYDVEYPLFDQEIRRKDGNEIEISGHYLPLDYGKDKIILSKLPFASCFFCGGGVGQETIAEIHFASEPRRFIPDEILTIKGRLKLNENDYDHMVFIIEEAELIE
ncbi:MAG: hypothetical protein R8G66_18570 [Cytophagales bacterium]|nr:hypothetical protein [Cytophagales bacterium]